MGVPGPRVRIEWMAIHFGDCPAMEEIQAIGRWAWCGLERSAAVLIAMALHNLQRTKQNYDKIARQNALRACRQ
jgi:hypothetical protein